MEVEGWILDAYAGDPGQMVIWLKTPDGAAVRLTDRWSNTIYVASDSASALEHLSGRLEIRPFVSSAGFVMKRENVFDYKQKEVLALQLCRANDAERLARTVERCEGSDEYRIYNADLLPAQVYFIENDLFPLARVKAVQDSGKVEWELNDANTRSDYEIPPLRRALLTVKVDSAGAIPTFSDPVGSIGVKTSQRTVEISEGSEGEKLLSMVRAIRDADPDLLFVEHGDEFTTHYLAERAYLNGVAGGLVLGRDPMPLRRMSNRGTSYFAYGRVLHTPTSHQIYGRINLDSENFFVYTECGLDGLFEVARLSRMPLHKGSRASIGKCLSSMQAYIAFKDNLLIPWKPTRTEIPKTANTLLLGDRGGFIYEPKPGVHEKVGEIDFSSLFPFIMTKYNISAETVLCRCCPDSDAVVPDVGYNICTKRKGVIPRSLEPILQKRMLYKTLKKQAKDRDPERVKAYESRAGALKGILVCSFGYLSYRNAKFGLIDCHISVCAHARKILLDASRIAERRGFQVLHGIVDSLWVKRDRAGPGDFQQLCDEIEEEIGLPISFEGVYKWIAFLSSRMHRDVPVLNRYFGVFEDGEMKLRGIEARRSDTVKLVADCQREILRLFAAAQDTEGVKAMLPEALGIYAARTHAVLKGDVPLSDLVITSALSKDWNQYNTNLAHVSAVNQLAGEGLELLAGQTVSYVVTDYRSKVQEERVRPVQLLDESVGYDRRRYAELLTRGVVSILQPFGVEEGDLYAAAGIRKRR